MPGPDPVEELAALRDVSAAKLAATIKAYERALVSGSMGAAAQAQIERLVLQTVELSQMIGRLTVLASYDAATGAMSSPAAAILDVTRSPMNSGSTFDAMIGSFLSREPRLAIGHLNVAAAYEAGHVQAFAKAVTLDVTRRTQDRLAEAFVKGEGLASGSDAIAEMNDWSRNYSDLVFRNNLGTSFNSGMRLQMKDPDVEGIFVALELGGVRDSATRKNHSDAFGLTAATRDAVWQRWTPLLGHNCRCALSPVSKFELQERGLFRNGAVVPYFPPSFASAHPDPGFGGSFRI